MVLEKSGKGYVGGVRGRKGKGEMSSLKYNFKNQEQQKNSGLGQVL